MDLKGNGTGGEARNVSLCGRHCPRAIRASLGSQNAWEARPMAQHSEFENSFSTQIKEQKSAEKTQNLITNDTQ
jgi:hypothetical protein